MFLRFDSQEDRRKYGGSCFIELQFCKLPFGTRINRIINEYNHWHPALSSFSFVSYHSVQG